MSIEATTTKTTTVQHSVKLGAGDILDMLRKAGVPVPDSAVASDLRITVRVPGGGDWSNTNIDISASNPVVIEWKETRHG